MASEICSSPTASSRTSAPICPRATRTWSDLPDGLVVTPGLIDMHVHLREPGQEHKETIATGSGVGRRRRLHRGRVHAEHRPGQRSGERHAVHPEARRRGRRSRASIRSARCRSGSKGEQLAEIGDLRAAGCVAVSDDGRPVLTALLMRRALEYTAMCGIPVIDHCEDPSLKGDGVAHEGYHASRLGLRGIPGEAEEIWVERDVTLAGPDRRPLPRRASQHRAARCAPCARARSAASPSPARSRRITSS